MKTCNKCGDTKDVECFGLYQERQANGGTKFIRRSTCTLCRRKARPKKEVPPIELTGSAYWLTRHWACQYVEADDV